jgi:predicted NAD/FAD-dependent oxidoreductase
MIQTAIPSVLMCIESNEFMNMNQLHEIDIQDLQVDYLLDYAVIGAGVAGLAAANQLNQLGYKIAVFEKARGTGGRISSKRVASADTDSFMAFDLGCISITAKSELFALELQDLHQQGVVAPWFKDDKSNTHYVGMPRNSGLTRHLSKDLECYFSTRITSIEHLEGLWHLFTIESGQKTLLAKASNIILATPPAQAYDLLPSNTQLKGMLEDVEVDPQWVMGIELDNVLPALPAIYYPDSDVIYSISQESSKPGRSADTLVLQIQATPSWTNKHLDVTSDQISELLITELERIFEQALNVNNSYSHRWLYSIASKVVQTNDGFLWDEKGLGLIGDYLISDHINGGFIGNDVTGIESAWLSGKQLADWLTIKRSKQTSNVVEP